MNSSKKALNWLALTAVVFATTAWAEEKTKPVTFGGFLDAYYNYDFNKPGDHNRAYTTQPARTNEPNVNLGYLDAKLSTDRFRGRLAAQAGTSVKANYAAEKSSLVKYIQEAVVGYQVTDKFWIDGGIYLSHIGYESWISKENWTYTRSLVGDFSPYYQSGAKATYQWSDKLSTQLNILNGWQNISSSTNGPALGLQVAYTATEKFSATYNNFVGQYPGSQWRFFNDFIAKYSLTEALQVAATYDVGLQETTAGSTAVWQGYAAFVRYQFHPKFALTLRGEQYFDKKQANVVTNTPNGFQTSGASINADVALHKQILWRTELRGLWSKDTIFPAKTAPSTRDGFVVTSFAFWF
jgi:hypothetical protein